MIILYVVFFSFFFSSKKFIVTNVTGLKAQVLLDYILLVLVVIVYFLNSYFSVYYYIQFFEFKVSIFSIHDLFLCNLFFKTANLSVQLFYTKRFFFFFLSFFSFYRNIWHHKYNVLPKGFYSLAYNFNIYFYVLNIDIFFSIF